jgi:hypothetical protein
MPLLQLIHEELRMTTGGIIFLGFVCVLALAFMITLAWASNRTSD